MHGGPSRVATPAVWKGPLVSLRRIGTLATIMCCLLAACGVDGGSEADPATTAPTSTTAASSTTTALEQSSDPDQALVDAVEATLGASSFAIESEANLEIGPQEFKLQTAGPVDYDELVASVVINVDGGSSKAEVELRSDGTTLWVRPEGTAASGIDLPSGVSWIEGDAQRLEAASTFDPAGLLGVVLALRASDGAQEVGSAELDGTEVTRYQTTVDYDDAVEAAGDDAEAFQSALSLTAPGSIGLDISVSVGDDGVIREFGLDVVSDTPALGGDYTVELTDVGQSVEKPDAPPSDQVLSGPEADAILDKILE